MTKPTHTLLLLAAFFLLAAPVANASPSLSGDRVGVCSVRNDVREITDTVRRSFDVGSGGRLELELDRGNIDVRSGDGSVVRIEVVRRAKVSRDVTAKQVWDLHDLDISERRGDVSILSSWESSESGGWMGRSRNRIWDELNVDVTVFVPRAFDVTFRTAAGNVAIVGIEGEVGGRSGAGNVAFRDIDGMVDVYTGSGNVEVDRIDGDVRINTGAGNVEVGRVLGQVTAKTGAGNVSGYFPRATGAPISLSTGAGNVTAVVRSGVGFDVEARTGIGSASTQYGDLDVSDGMMGGRFNGRINGGGPLLALRTGIGNVELKRR